MAQYSSLLTQSPVANRNTNDRFLSPARSPAKQRISITPDREMHRRLSRLSTVGFRQAPEDNRMNSPRPSAAMKLLQSQSQGCFNRRSNRPSTNGRESMSPGGSAAVTGRNYPSKPSRTVVIDNSPSDFYISPMDWSKKNVVAFALQDKLLFINPKTMEVVEPSNVPEDVVSLKYSPSGNSLFLGCDCGIGSLYDTMRYEIIQDLELFTSSVLVADWKGSTIVAGGREGQIAIVDVRDESSECIIDDAHIEEVCAVRMHGETSMCATSGNDCAVKIWDMRNMTAGPVMTYTEHEAAVRAVAWSPMTDNVIVTGGGTACKSIKMWNASTGETIHSVNTGSQVCNLHWNAEYNEILSTHGFSQNHLGLWKGTDLTPVASFHTHKQRVLYMCASADGHSVATVAPEDTLQIWSMFSPRNVSLTQSLLLLR